MKTMSGKTSSLPPPSLPLASHSIPQASPLLSLLHFTSSRFFPLLLSPPPVSSHSSFSISPFLLSFLLPLNLSPHPYLVSLSPPLFLASIQLASPISFAPFLSPLPFILFLSFVTPSPFSLLNHIFLFLLHILFSLFLVFLVILHPWPRSLTFLQRLAGSQV